MLFVIPVINVCLIALSLFLWQFLAEKSHWPSYNVPYFQEIYNISGGPEQVKDHTLDNAEV